MRKIAKQILVFSALLSLFIFTGKIFSKPSVNNDLGNEIATQVYYDHKLSWKNIFINVLLTSQRVKHELTEVGRDSTLSTEKV
ncbi:MAG: hypothetical protein PHX62_03375, partial [Bacilli bacterium]|nr:hypothetical protein [Bacilli bacterium]